MTSWIRIALAVALLSTVATTAGAETPAGIPAGQDFGAGIALDEPTSLAEILRSPDRYTERPALVRGRLTDVCQKKGCWTVLADGAEQIRVRFEDYGFFVPKNSIGQEAYVEGRVTIRIVSEQEARHYEEESRSGDPDAIRGPRREVGFLASGVRILGRSSKGETPSD